MSSISEIMASLAGKRIPGGCDSCDAYQVAEVADPAPPGVTVIHVYHDDDSPELARKRPPQ
jgi:hypothetical protein